jgi:sarcosine dehydrogenase
MNAERFPDAAQVVVIGGGIIGCSTAYHLAKNGCTDVVVLERAKLTSGSTWHAAGAVGQLRANANITRLLGYSVELYGQLEAETGLATGWVQNGSLRLACNEDRRAEYERAATMAHSFGLAFEMISPAEARDLVPVLNIDDLVCAAYVASDGVASPSDLAMALARGARQQGARIFEGVSVTDVTVEHGAVTGAVTTHGTIRCERVVACCGIWTRAVGRLAGVDVPLMPSHHQYFVTDVIEGLPRHIPTIRDPDFLTYFKEEVGGLAIGGYELTPKPFAGGDPPADLEFHLFPEDLDQFDPLMRGALHRVPALETVGVKQWFNGLESFTEDGMFILGEAPEVRGFFVGAGFNSFGIASAGGAGRVLAEWILDGEPPFDLWVADIRRFARFNRSDAQVRARALEGQAHHYVMGWPYYERQAGRPFRRSALYDRLQGNGACFGVKAGWERANWFAPAGVEARDEYTWGRANWFPHVAAEHQACREAVALFDQSSFAKLAVMGPDAERILDRLCAGAVARPPGRVTYTQMLNDKGGIEADLTVTRIAEDEYYIVTGTAFATHDFGHIRRHTPEDARVSYVDVTSAFATVSIMGPQSRAVLASVTEGDLSDQGFPFATWRELMVAGAPVRAVRITFVGELGWELHVPTEYAVHVYDALKAAGADAGIRDAGYRAIDSLRLEKAYRLWAADIGPDYTPLEAGLGFAVAWKKNVGFVGRDALLRQRETGLTKRLVTFTHDDRDAILLGGETIYRDGERVGWLSSAGHGHTVGRDIGLGYVRHAEGVDGDFLTSGRYELEVRTRRVPAEIHLQALYDPKGDRVKM